MRGGIKHPPSPNSRLTAAPSCPIRPTRLHAFSQATKINGPGCTILDNAERIRYPQAPHHLRKYQDKGHMAVYDIEEAVREGEGEKSGADPLTARPLSTSVL